MVYVQLRLLISRKWAFQLLALLMTGIRKGAIQSLRVSNLEKITQYSDKEGRLQRWQCVYCRLTTYNPPSESV
jgi:hypothetical protein